MWRVPFHLLLFKCCGCRIFFSDSPSCKFGIVTYGKLVKEYEHSVQPWATSPLMGNQGDGYCLKRIVKNKRRIPKNPIAGGDHVDATNDHYCFAFGSGVQRGLVFSCSCLSEGVMYSNHFTTEVRWIFRQTSPNTISMAVHGDLKFTKSVNFLVKPIIIKTTKANIKETLEVSRLRIACHCSSQQTQFFFCSLRTCNKFTLFNFDTNCQLMCRS